MKTNKTLMMLSLLACVACGGGGGGGGSNDPQFQEMDEATPGTYYTVLRPVNFQANGYIAYGSATIKLSGDQVQVSTSMDDDQPVPHRQSLHIGSRCPTLSDDENGDGFVDYNEAMRVVGKVVVPFDGNLNTRSSGAEVYPRGLGMTYNRTGSFASMNKDLGPESLGFETRVVLIHGTSFNSAHPTSLAGRGSEAAHLSLPVVCGVLKKID